MKQRPFSDLNRLEQSLPLICKGVNRYISIMERFHNTDVRTDDNFQRMYNGFYRVRRNKEFRTAYYEFMESNKHNTDLSFEMTLGFLFQKFHRVEPSFSSELVATINTQKPVWDSIILPNLGLATPSPNIAPEIRVNMCLNIYDEIEQWYKNFLPTVECDDVVAIFDRCYPNSPISRFKKVDLALWSLRA